MAETHIGGATFEAMQGQMLALADTVEKLLRIDGERAEQVTMLEVANANLRRDLNRVRDDLGDLAIVARALQNEARDRQAR